MTKKVVSWRDRRWKLFENKWALDDEFKRSLIDLFAQLNKDTDEVKISETADELHTILMEHKVPIECSLAVSKFILHPTLNRQEYLEVITPPLRFWKPSAKYMAPENTDTPEVFYGKRFDNLIGKKDERNEEIFFSLADILRLVALNTTVLHISSYVSITELHELIDEYWKDLEPLINARSPLNDNMFNEKLLERIDAAPTADDVKRMQIIMYYTDEGLNDTQIYWKLEAEGVDIPQEQIRVYRSRLLKTYKFSRR